MRLDGRPWALEINEDGRPFDARVASTRRLVTWVVLLGLGVAFVLFYLLGGRTLSRRHRQLVGRATLDPLTELGNHRSFVDELRRAVTTAARRREPLAVAIIDVDDFKFLNDSRGHRAGDATLVALAGVLSRGRAGDRAFRIGGDEFALLLPGSDGAAARAVLERMLAQAGGGAHPTAFTAGVAAAVPAPDDEPAVLHEQADAALYEGKRAGGATIVVFDDVAELLSVVTPSRVRALRGLLDDACVDVVFQPIWRLADGGVLGVEALARPCAASGFDGPAGAFAVAEKIGRAHELDGLCRAVALERAGEVPPDALLFLNIHPQTFDRGVLDVERLARAVRSAGREPTDVVLEVTERSSARAAHLRRGVTALREAGFRIALDDVGAGNAGLGMLRDLEVDFVKIDREIVAAAPEDPNAHAILLAIVAYAHRTGALVIAEGIETEAILSFICEVHDIDVHELAIDGGQGYLLGRPQTAPPRAGAQAASVARSAVKPG